MSEKRLKKSQPLRCCFKNRGRVFLPAPGSAGGRSTWIAAEFEESQSVRFSSSRIGLLVTRSASPGRALIFTHIFWIFLRHSPISSYLCIRMESDAMLDSMQWANVHLEMRH